MGIGHLARRDALEIGYGLGDRTLRSQLCRWLDEHGVVHLTDNADTVPEQFRKQAKR